MRVQASKVFCDAWHMFIIRLVSCVVEFAELGNFQAISIPDNRCFRCIVL